MTLAIAEAVMVRVCLLSGLEPVQIRARSRKQALCRLRYAMVYAIRQRSDWSYPKIARFLGFKDHSAALHGQHIADALILQDADFKILIEDLLAVPIMLPAMLDEQLRRSRAGEPLLTAEPAQPVVPPPIETTEAVAVITVAQAARPTFLALLAPSRPAKAIVLTDDDMQPTERKAKRAMVRGSAKLRLAIRAARNAQAHQPTTGA